MKLIWFSVIICFIAAAICGQSLYDSNNNHNIDETIKKFDTSLNITFATDNNSSLVNIVGHVGNFIVGISKEVGKIGINWGFEHPDFNFQGLVNWITNFGQLLNFWGYVFGAIISLFAGIGIFWAILAIKKKYFNKNESNR